MKIAHEAPLDIFDDVQHLTDYDYALVHLFEKSEKYFDKFVRSLHLGRDVILDNSIFELGDAFDSDKFAKWVEKLKPSYYIVPDVLQKGYDTMEKFEDFLDLTGKDLPGGVIGVVQGRTYGELVSCYRFMSNKADCIAISFDYDYYLTTGWMGWEGEPTNPKLLAYATGRRAFIRSLIRDGFWDYSKPHHLLGNSLAREVGWYSDIKNIYSVDTSNPVVAGLEGKRYIPGVGLNNKSTKKLVEYMFETTPVDRISDITYNIEKYRQIVNPNY